MYWIFIQALQTFHTEKSRLPAPYSEVLLTFEMEIPCDNIQDDTTTLVAICNQLKSLLTEPLPADEWKEDVLRLLIKTCSGDISPMVRE